MTTLDTYHLTVPSSYVQGLEEALKRISELKGKHMQYKRGPEQQCSLSFFMGKPPLYMVEFKIEHDFTSRKELKRAIREHKGLPQ
jgi:hypothetical protein